MVVGGSAGVGPLLTAVDAHDHPGRAVERLLASVRELLAMEVVFLSQFADDLRLFRFANGDLERFGIELGTGDPLEETYCQRMVGGILPSLVADAAAHPVTAELPITALRSIGCYIGVPVRFSDGELYGTLCCFSADPRSDASLRDVAFMQVAASVLADQLERDEWSCRDWRAARGRLREVIDQQALDMVYQPIVDLRDGRLLGVEALARFRPEPVRPPDAWFDEAWSVGVGRELELAAVRRALAADEHVPAGAYLAVNVSHETLLSPDLLTELERVDPARVVVELTEHTRISEYPPVRTVLGGYRDLGIQLAIDDWGTGYAGMNHLLELRPDIIKLDVALVRDIADDPLRRVTAEALVQVGRAAGATIVAEGIETQQQLEVLRSVGIEAGQGYHLARPGPLPPVVGPGG